MTPHSHEIIAQAIHNVISGFRVATGQSPLAPLTPQSPLNGLLHGIIDYIDQTPTITPDQVHDFWLAWAWKYSISHDQLVPFEDLAPYEKIKDKLLIDVVKSFRVYAIPNTPFP